MQTQQTKKVDLQKRLEAMYVVVLKVSRQ